MGKLKIKRKRITTVQAGIVDPVHVIPVAGQKDGEKIDLSVIKGWDKLTIEMKRYLVEFSKNKLKRKRAAIALGYSTSKITEWEGTQPFGRIYNDIIDLHAEGVEEIDYIASFNPNNNTSRGRFLSKRSKIYKEEQSDAPARIGTQNNQTNILAILNSDETTAKGLAGVKDAFQQLKKQGKLPSKK